MLALVLCKTIILNFVNNCFLILCSVNQQDFGDYLESYYSVQTIEGEKISQLIAGYIDIILKKVNNINNNKQ